MTYPETPGYQQNENSKAMAKWLEETGKAKTLRHKVYNLIYNAGVEGSTTEEAGRCLRIYNSSVAARFRELELGGAIVRTARTRNIEGVKRKCHVYVITGEAYSPPEDSKRKLSKYDAGRKDALLDMRAYIRTSVFHDTTAHAILKHIDKTIEKIG